MKLARTTSGKYIVEAVAKAIDVLETFTSSDGLTLMEISQRVGLNKSRTFRLLCTLAERGYVERSSDGARYQLGVKLFERAALVRRSLRDVARPFMLDLQERFNEMVNLGTLDNGHVLYLDIVESSRPFRMSATVGCRMSTHQTSMGKAMLAYLRADDPACASQALLPKLSKQRLAALGRELEMVRHHGYAIDKEENEPGVACIGVPVFDPAGLPVAAMSISGPAHRVLASEKKIAEALLAACKRMSKSLDFGSVAANTTGATAQLARSAGAAKS